MTGELYVISGLDQATLRPLLRASVEEGYDFVPRLWDEHKSGVERFDKAGAVLLGMKDEQGVMAIGGVGIDPYEGQPTIGRIRHVYVLPAYRRTGAGSRLMQGLIEYARGHFTVLTLRTLTDHGDAFYRALGFNGEKRFPQATHWMALREE